MKAEQMWLKEPMSVKREENKGEEQEEGKVEQYEGQLKRGFLASSRGDDQSMSEGEREMDPSLFVPCLS